MADVPGCTGSVACRSAGCWPPAACAVLPRARWRDGCTARAVLAGPRSPAGSAPGTAPWMGVPPPGPAARSADAALKFRCCPRLPAVG